MTIGRKRKVNSSKNAQIYKLVSDTKNSIDSLTKNFSKEQEEIDLELKILDQNKSNSELLQAMIFTGELEVDESLQVSSSNSLSKKLSKQMKFERNNEIKPI